ncbi:MAG: hypothetical protein K6F86_06535 [Lachnospiraceae bacterium]|nr:hypothetical protein [Lachnospiraceae bacterium]
MFRMWVREWKDNHMLRDTVVVDDTDDTRTHKVFNALNKACAEFDIAVPIWLNSNIEDFKRNSKTRFRPESFVEETEFDYLEIHVIEEDQTWTE